MARLQAKWMEDKILRIDVAATQTANFNAESGNMYPVSPSGASVDVTLPAPSAGAHIWIKDVSNDLPTKTINIVRNGTENIDGVAANIEVESNYETVKLVSNGTDWFRV
jgi:hypothetical protein